MAYRTPGAPLAALADPTRRAIYESLTGTPRAVGEIARDFAVSRPAVSQHLRTLRECGLATETREGTRHLYAADAAAALALRDYFQAIGTRSAMDARPAGPDTAPHYVRARSRT